MSNFEVRTTLRTPDIDGFYVVGRVGKQKIITKNITKEFVKFCWLSGVKSFSLELYYQVYYQGFSYRYFTKFEADFNHQIEDFFNHPYMEPEIKPHKDKLLFYLKNYKGPR